MSSINPTFYLKWWETWDPYLYLPVWSPNPFYPIGCFSSRNRPLTHLTAQLFIVCSGKIVFIQGRHKKYGGYKLSLQMSVYTISHSLSTFCFPRKLNLRYFWVPHPLFPERCPSSRAFKRLSITAEVMGHLQPAHLDIQWYNRFSLSLLLPCNSPGHRKLSFYFRALQLWETLEGCLSIKPLIATMNPSVL